MLRRLLGDMMEVPERAESPLQLRRLAGYYVLLLFWLGIAALLGLVFFALPGHKFTDRSLLFVVVLEAVGLLALLWLWLRPLVSCAVYSLRYGQLVRGLLNDISTRWWTSYTFVPAVALWIVFGIPQLWHSGQHPPGIPALRGLVIAVILGLVAAPVLRAILFRVTSDGEGPQARVPVSPKRPRSAAIASHGAKTEVLPIVDDGDFTPLRVPRF